MKKDIFWQGKIYTGVETLGMDSMPDYGNYLPLFANYSVQAHNFKDGEDVTGRYELKRQFMDLYAEKGTKVLPTIVNGVVLNGGEYDKEKVLKHLKEGVFYTVDKTDVGNWSTSVYLKEIPNITFNSVNLLSEQLVAVPLPTDELELKNIVAYDGMGEDFNQPITPRDESREPTASEIWDKAGESWINAVSGEEGQQDKNIVDFAKIHAKNVEQFYSSTKEGYLLRAKNSFIAGFEYAQQFTAKEVPANFLEYCKDARNKFYGFIINYEWNTDLRTEIDDLLTCFDQMKERLESPNIQYPDYSQG